MKISAHVAALSTAAFFFFALTARQGAAQELNAEGKSKEVAEARAKRNAQIFKNNASVLTFLDSYGKRKGQVGEKAMYENAVVSPDGKRIATIKDDLENESADLWVLEVATGVSTRFTTSVRTEFVLESVWSPDSKRLVYVAMRAGQESIFTRSADGKGTEELVYKNPGAFMDLSDWSSDGRFLTFAISDIKGGTLYTLALEGAPNSKPIEICHSDLNIAEPRFSPHGRYLSYIVRDKADKSEIFVRSSDPAAKEGPWQISDGSFSPGYWVHGGKGLYYMARDRSVMASEISTSPSFTFSKPRVLFRQEAAVPDPLMDISADGERFLVIPPARGQELQQVTIFNRKGQVVKKVGEPALYAQPSFSPDGNRLLVMKEDVKTGQRDLWVIDIDTTKATSISDDTRFKTTPLWSPDGKSVFYTALLDGDWTVHRKAADGTGKEESMFRYTPGAFVGVSDVSPDGKFLVCDSGGVVFLVPLTENDPAARKPVDYLRDEFVNEIGRLSPDGRFVAYRSDEAKPERFEVYVRLFDAAKPADDKKWKVSKDGVLGMLHWRGDGKEIFFRAQELDSDDLVMTSADVDTTPAFKVGTPKVLFRLPGPINGSLGGISRDGQRFVFAINVSADKTEHSSGSN